MNIEPVVLNVEDQKIRGNFYVPTANYKKGALLFLHGWTGKPNERAATLLANKGFYCLTISMRGHNNSDGDIKTVTAQDSLNDAVAAYDFLRAHIPDDVAIISVGNSYGGYITALLSGERQLKAISLRVPANYPDEGFNEPKWGRGNDDPVINTWRHSVVMPTENRALWLIGDFKGPIQIIEAEKDEIVPSQTVKNYVDAVANKDQLEYVLMADWPHSLGDNQQNNQQFQQVLLRWLLKQV